MSQGAAARLAQVQAEITRLQAEAFELGCQARQEAADEEQRKHVSDWESERNLFGNPYEAPENRITSVATYPQDSPSRTTQWHIGVGCGGKLLAVYAVFGARARLEHGDPPLEVQLQVLRVYGLKLASASGF